MKNRVWDVAGIGVSMVCLAHCLALPFVATALPVLGALMEAEGAHWLMLALATPTAVIAMAPLIHQRGVRCIPLVAAGIGLAFMLAGALDLPSHAWGEMLTIAGVLSLSLAHILNWRTRRRRGEQGVADACSCPGTPSGATAERPM